MSIVRSDKPFVLAGRTYQSRLLVGTGKYRSRAHLPPGP
jgi:thiazole synthase